MKSYEPKLVYVNSENKITISKNSIAMQVA